MKNFLPLFISLTVLSINSLFAQELSQLNQFNSVNRENLNKSERTYKKPISVLNNLHGDCFITVNYDDIIVEEAVFDINTYAGHLGYTAVEEYGNLVIYVGGYRAVNPQDISFNHGTPSFYAWRDIVYYSSSNAFTLTCQ